MTGTRLGFFAALATLGLVDPINYVGHAAPASLFLQAARSDQYVPRKVTESFARSASTPKRITWYSTDHGGLLLYKRALNDRESWLAGKLRLPPA